MGKEPTIRLHYFLESHGLGKNLRSLIQLIVPGEYCRRIATAAQQTDPLGQLEVALLDPVSSVLVS